MGMHEPITALSQRIIGYRAIHNLSQKDLADICGLDRTTIVRAENGKPVSKITIAKIEMAIREDKR